MHFSMLRDDNTPGLRNYAKIKTKSLELVELVKNIYCNFIDARATTKDYLAKVVRDNGLDKKIALPGQFIVSTCLRYEVYNFKE